jgi:hypothetical protein
MFTRFKSGTLALLAACAAGLKATMSTPADVGADTTQYLASDSVRQQFNILMQDLRYFLQHQIFTSAALAIATVTSQVKSVAASVYSTSTGIFTLAATDNFWTLGTATSNTNVAIGGFQKYLLCVNAAGAASVIEGLQNLVSLATVTFPKQPAVGVTIVGILHVTNATNVFIPGTTLLGAAGVTAAFQNGVNTDDMMAAKVRP